MKRNLADRTSTRQNPTGLRYSQDMDHGLTAIIVAFPDGLAGERRWGALRAVLPAR
jgi:hypothetical protein